MPTIGTLRFDLEDGLDSGIALPLAKPPEEEVCIQYGDCQLMASPTTPHVICRFSGATSFDMAYDKGSASAQECLDILSMLGHADLITRNADTEYLLWWQASGRNTIALVSTSTYSEKVWATCTVQDAQGNVVPPATPTPEYHIGFRFYRLSQVSDDLYDAYRNMYLALESLLSSKYPKSTKEGEKTWLGRSLTSASSDLFLSNLVPLTTSNDVAQEIINHIYKEARLPLFHAKVGESHFAPVNSASEREKVANALELLTQIVLRMASTWFSAHRSRSEINPQSFVESRQHLMSSGNLHFVFSDNPVFDAAFFDGAFDNLESNTIKNENGLSFPARLSKDFGRHVNKLNVFGEIPVSELAHRGRLNAIYLTKAGSIREGFSPDTTVDLTGFDDLQVLLFMRLHNMGAPKYLYTR